MRRQRDRHARRAEGPGDHRHRRAVQGALRAARQPRGRQGHCRHHHSGRTRRRVALGDVIADAQLASTAPTNFGGAQIAFMNPGGIRADVVFIQQSRRGTGEVTYGEAFTVQPFGNTLVIKTMTGTQIQRAARAAVRRLWRPATKRILQISAGFSCTLDLTRPAGGARAGVDQAQRHRSTRGTYRVTMNNFLASGGDGFTVFNRAPTRSAARSTSTRGHYFQAKSPIGPGGPQNRFTRLG